MVIKHRHYTQKYAHVFTCIHQDKSALQVQVASRIHPLGGGQLVFDGSSTASEAVWRMFRQLTKADNFRLIMARNLRQCMQLFNP